MRPDVSVFIDANVFYSASYKPVNKFLRLWRLPGVAPITSLYVAGETRRNAATAEQKQLIEELLALTRIVSDPTDPFLPPSISLPKKDVPVLAAAIAAGADYLLTSDKRHFSRYYGLTVAGTTIMNPSAFLGRYAERAEGES